MTSAPIAVRSSFGLQQTADGLSAHPGERVACEAAFELFLEHRRKKTVARILNQRGFRTRGGGLFSDTSVDRLLRNVTLLDVGVVSHEAWDRVQELLATQATTAPARTARHLFSGVVRCRCGAVMYPKPPAAKYLCQTCNRKISADDLEAIVTSEFAHLDSLPEHLPQLWPTLPFDQKRIVVEALFDRIVADDDAIELYFSV